MTRKQVALIAWLCLPVLAVAALCYIMATNLSMESRAKNREMFPPRGAGAGDTGGVNAVGEVLAGKAANHGRALGHAGTPEVAGVVQAERYSRGFVIEVRDATGEHAVDKPLYLRGTMVTQGATLWKWMLRPAGEGLWRGEFDGEEGSPLWLFVVARSPDGPDEVLPGGEQYRTLPAFEPSMLADGTRPTVSFVVTRWSGTIDGSPE